MRFCFALLVFVVASGASAQGTGTIAGQVFEDDGVTAVIGANVRVDGTTLGVATDIDGNYRILGVPVGTYTVTASYVGFRSQTWSNVTVGEGARYEINFNLHLAVSDCSPITRMPMTTVPTSADVYSPRVLYGWDIEQIPINR